MLKKVPSMRKKGDATPGSPALQSDPLSVETPGAATPPNAQRKKTVGGKRGSIFASLFSKSHTKPSEDEESVPVDGAASAEPFITNSGQHSPKYRAVRDPSDYDSMSDPPSPQRDWSRESPPQHMTRKGSKERESAAGETNGNGNNPPSPSVFDVSDRKEASRTNKSRAQGSRKEGVLGALFQPSARLDGSRSESMLSTDGATRRDGSRSHGKISSPGARYVMSARLPALTVVDTSDSQSVNSFMSAHQWLESRPRAESDPCPICASTLEDDFGFEDDAKVGGDGKAGGDDIVLGSRKSSFQKPRAPSFNSETRNWEGRRSLQLSINQSDVGGSVHVSAATLDRLVEYVVSSNEFMEASQVSGFLLTYHSYVNSQGLLAALASRYDVSTDAKNQVARIRTLYVLQRWIEEHWYDFESDDILLLGVVQFALTRLNKEYPNADAEENKHDPCFSLLKKLASVQQLAQSKMEKRVIEEQQAAVAAVGEEDDEAHKDGSKEEPPMKEHSNIAPRLLKHQSKLLIKLEKAPPLEVVNNFAAVWATKLEGKPMHVVLASNLVGKVETARQITLLEHNMYKRIPPTELLAQATKQMAKPPENVRSMIAHFNDVSRFVALSICSFTELSPRVYMLRKWIKIGRECLRLNNYNAVFEIMAGIHSVAVHRLNRTRASLNVKTRNILLKLEEVTSRKNNYGTYRTLLAQNTVPIQPAVPFIGATLTDLSFLDFGHRNMVENGEGDTLINFTKHRRVAQVIGTIKKFQDHPYLLDVCPEISRFLQVEMTKATEINDKELYAMSLACEPPSASASSQAQTNFFEFDGTVEPPTGSSSTPTNHKRAESKAGFLLSKIKNSSNIL